MVALNKPDAVIFDWDNTLVDTWPIIYAALVQTFEAFDMEPWSLDMVKSNVKKSMRDSFPLVFGDEWQKAGEIYQQSYRATALENLTPLAAAEKTLQMLKAQAIPLFIVSNKKGDQLRREVTHLGWDHYFLSVVGAGDAANDKPKTDPVWHAVKPHGFEEAGNMWFIGDSDADIECAHNLGCKAMLYGEHAKTLPDYTPNSLSGFDFIYHADNHDDLQTLLDF